MSQQDLPLDQVQRWLQAVIVHPDGVEAGIASNTARAEIPLSPERVEELISPSKSLTSVERLQVYSGAYFARLLECMREEFPALVHALGNEIFDGFAFGYLQAYPSRSYTLAMLAQDFPQYLEETRLDNATKIAENTLDWPDFLIDLATTERIYSEVFSGPGVEGQRLLQPHDIAAIAADQIPKARLVPVPCLRLLSLNFPVHGFISAVRDGSNPSIPAPSPTRLVITRREYVVRRNSVSELEFELLALLKCGHTIGEAIESVTGRSEFAYSELEAHLAEWSHHWAVAGYFQDIDHSH